MKTKLFSLVAVACFTGLIACDDNASSKTNADSTNNSTATTPESTTTSGDYAAKADEIQKNSEAGKYMDARTGKPIRLSMDRTSGRVMNAENNEQVTRYIYVDNNDWWALDWEGNRLGKAKWENDKVWYEGDDGKWLEYDSKWKDDATDTKVKTDSDGEMKIKSGDTKIKIEKDGDTKIKTDDKKIKTEDGKTKVKDN